MIYFLKKFLIRTTLLITLLFLSISSLQAKELFFILAGQSNMAGQGIAAKLNQKYRQPLKNVTFYFNGYKAPLNRFKHFGPEIGFAYEMSKRFPHDEIKLIKFAIGGTSLFAWDPNWNPNKAHLTRNSSAGPLFKKLLKTAQIQFDKESSKLAAIIWMQGETDAFYPLPAKQYAQNLRTFVRALRTELNSPNTAFIMGKINPPENLFHYTKLVQQAQRVAAKQIRNTRLINTSDLKKRNDHLHYNTEGQLELGKRFAREFIKRYR